MGDTVLGNTPWVNGVHYWEIRVDSIDLEDNLVLGIAKESVDLTINPMDTGLYWGY